MLGGHASAQDGKRGLEQPGLITPFVLFMAMSKDGSDSVGWCLDLWRCSEKPGSHTQTYVCTCIISWLESFAQVYLCHWLAGSNVMCLHIHK